MVPYLGTIYIWYLNKALVASSGWLIHRCTTSTAGVFTLKQSTRDINCVGRWILIVYWWFFFTFAKLWGSDSRLTALIAYLSTLMQNRNGKLLLMTRFYIFLPGSFTALLCRSLSTFKKIRISVSYWHSNCWSISGFHDMDGKASACLVIHYME